MSNETTHCNRCARPLDVADADPRAARTPEAVRRQGYVAYGAPAEPRAVCFDCITHAEADILFRTIPEPTRPPAGRQSAPAVREWRDAGRPAARGRFGRPSVVTAG